MKRILLAAVAAIIAVAAPAAAHEVKIGTLELTDLWTRATPPGAPAAAGSSPSPTPATRPTA